MLVLERVEEEDLLLLVMTETPPRHLVVIIVVSVLLFLLPTMTMSLSKLSNRVYVAVGSNLGDRFGNIQKALDLLCNNKNNPSIALKRTSFLHETAPMYVTDQPAFLNGAVELETDLAPSDLLARLKDVEKRVGRDLQSGVRYGPRTVDLDIILYDNAVVVDTDELSVPHPRMQEREFVLVPLVEVAGPDLTHPVLQKTAGNLLSDLLRNLDRSAVRVLPLPRGRLLRFDQTIIMGVLNVTPDSFSDGGRWNGAILNAVHRALEMEREGAGIIDIGGESTRPGAKEVDLDEELERTIPVIREIRKESDVPISIDTRHSLIAKEAILAGADMVNDVSGGLHDPDMLPTVSRLGVPMILMHMRGTPETMQKMTVYEDVVEEVASAVEERSVAAETLGIHRWQQVVDPGIGFAKDLAGNLSLLGNLAKIRSQSGNLPILLGTSRKGFIGRVSGEEVPEKRDPGTIASNVAALCLDQTAADGCNILRVHNVADTVQAVKVMDAIRRA